MGERWRVGRKVGRTIYDTGRDGANPDGGELIGVMDTRELAATVVEAVNEFPLLKAHVARLDAKLVRLFAWLERYPGLVGSKEVKAILDCGHDAHPAECRQCGAVDP